MEKPHKFDIGEGYGIWTDDTGTTHRHFPEEFLRAKGGDTAGAYKIGDFAVMNQPTYKKRFGMFVIANVETGDFGGAGLKYRITVKPYGTPVEIRGLKPAAPIQASGRIGKPAAPIQQADNKEKEPKVKRPTYVMKKIKLADCKPHADAEAYSASTSDRLALDNSIGETGVLSPIAVIADTPDGAGESGRGWFVIDGIGRMNAMIAAGETETDAQVFDLGDLSVAEFVVCKNAMMRKVTTGTRVMAYLKCHEREVLAAADPEKYQRRPGNEKNFKGRAKARLSQAVSRETASQKGWGAKEIAERLGVSKNDVLAGVELLKAMGEATPDGAGESGRGAGPSYEQGDLFETLDAVMHGETPIRRWKAAVCGKQPRTGGKAAADYTAIGARTMASLAGLFENWQTVPMDCRAAIIEKFKAALEVAPDDFRVVMEAAVSAHAEAQRGGERRGKFRKGTRW